MMKKWKIGAAILLLVAILCLCASCDGSYYKTGNRITGGSDVGLHEANTAAELVQRSADPEANIIFGSVIDDSMGDDIQITVIATGFENEEEKVKQATNIVEKAWEQKIGRSSSASDNNPSDLDIPTFLRKNKK